MKKPPDSIKLFRDYGVAIAKLQDRAAALRRELTGIEKAIVAVVEERELIERELKSTRRKRRTK